MAGLLFHDLRRSAEQKMRRAGTSEKIPISEHKTREVFDRYDIADSTHPEQARAKLEQFLKSRSKE